MDTAKLLAQIKGKQKQLEQRGKTAKLKGGRNKIRVLPGWRKDDPETFYHDFGAHWIKNEKGELVAVYICEANTFGRPCKTCSALEQAVKQVGNDDLMVKTLTEGKSGMRILVNALLYDGEDPTTPQLLELPRTAFSGLLALFDDYGNVLDPEAGRDIIINRTGSGLKTEYTVLPAPNASAVPKAALTKLHDIDKYVDQMNSMDERKAIGAIYSVAGIGPALEAPAVSRSAPARAIAAPASNEPTAVEKTPDDLELESSIDDLLNLNPEA